MPMQGGYEPRGSRWPGRGIYLVRRAVFVLIAIVLFAFVLPRACGAFSDPDATDSAVRQQESEQADAPTGSGGSSGGSVGGSSSSTSDDTTGGSLEIAGNSSPSGGSETGSEDSAGSGSEDEAGEDEADDASDDGSSEEDGESAMPSTMEESIAVEEPAEAAPSGIPTVRLAEGRDRQAARTQRQDPAQYTLEPSEITLALRSDPPRVEPISEEVQEQVSEQVQEDASETVSEQQQSIADTVRPRARSNRQQVAASATEELGRNAVRGARRISRSGNNIASTAGGGPAATVVNAQRLVSDVPRGEARAAVSGALRDAEASVSAAENLLGGSPTGKNNRCANNPARCLAAPALLD
jgi:hypothetical protein